MEKLRFILIGLDKDSLVFKAPIDHLRIQDASLY